MAKRTGEEDDGEVIDLTKKDDPQGGGGDDPVRDPPLETPAIESRNAEIERVERDEPAPRREAEPERDEPRETRRRDESDEDYSRRVRGRINREQAVTRRVQRQLDEQTSANNELRERLAKIERAQSAGAIEGDAKKKLSELQVKIDAVLLKLKAAKEAGDTALDLQFTIELTDLQAEKKIIEKRSEYQAEQIRNAAAAPGADPAHSADPREARIERMTARWQTANRKWWNLNRFRDIKADAIELDKDLRQEVKDGSLDIEEYSEEYFAELSTRLKENYPDLDVRGLDGEEIEAEPDDLDRDARHRDDDRRDDVPQRRGSRDRDPPPRRRPATGDMGTRDRRRVGNDPRQMAEQGRVRLTNADYAQMREYGLNPIDPKQKRKFAEERMRTILTEGKNERGGGR